MKKKPALLAVIAVLCLQYFSCKESENPIVTPPARTNVTGKVIGYFFNQGLPDAKVRIEDKFVITDSYGNFVINDVQIPYTVYITDSVTNSGSVYTGLSTSECWLPHFRDGIYNMPEGQINISLSGVSGNSNNSKVFFTDGNNVNGIGSGLHCNIYFADNQSAKGKVSVLLYTSDAGGAALSYDKFGYIDNVTITPGGNTNLVFTDSMLSYNPPETRVSGTITGFPSNGYINAEFMFLSMSPRKANYFATDCFFGLIYGNTFNLLIPSGLPVNFYPIYFLEFFDPNNNGQLGRVINLLPKAGGTGLNIQIPAAPQITYPTENSQVDTNTVFSSLAYTGPCIFHFLFSDGTKSFHLYTGNPGISLFYFRNLGIGMFAPNSAITLSVNTIGNFYYVDEYVNPYFSNVEQYSSIPVVQHYTMKP